MKTFVITGTLSKPREFIKKLIHTLGGRVVGSISNNVDYVVAGNDVIGTRKLDGANRLGIPIISEERMKSILRGGSRRGSGTKSKRLTASRLSTLSSGHTSRFLPLRIYERGVPAGIAKYIPGVKVYKKRTNGLSSLSRVKLVAAPRKRRVGSKSVTLKLPTPLYVRV